MSGSSLIWLASYPKSGNTWFRILLANLRLGRNQPVDINDSVGGQRSVLSREAFDDMTMFASGLLEVQEIERFRPTVYAALACECPTNTWEKVHYAWTRAPGGEPVLGWNSARAAVYLVRDPRDVAVSYAHHLNLSIDVTIDLLNSSEAVVCLSGKRQHPGLQGKLDNWSRHVASWLDQKDVPVHVVRYESLQADTAATFAGALRFAGEEVDSRDVERAVCFSCFSELKRQEETAGFCERSPAGSSLFFRRGQTGRWREELSDAQAARIVNKHGEMMERLGYRSQAT
jgi:aryl sulfotransferase